VAADSDGELAVEPRIPSALAAPQEEELAPALNHRVGDDLLEARRFLGVSPLDEITSGQDRPQEIPLGDAGSEPNQPLREEVREDLIPRDDVNELHGRGSLGEIGGGVVGVEAGGLKISKGEGAFFATMFFLSRS
jgi:hypothetical protein